MYFIPRNNAIYNYIAHTDSRRRSLATLFALVCLILFFYCGLYIPLINRIAAYQAELVRLRADYAMMKQINKDELKIAEQIVLAKKNIEQYAVSESIREDQYNKCVQSILNTIKKNGITLHSYGSCKQKDKQWYVSDMAHYQLMGSLDKLLSFLHTIIQNEHYLMSISQVSLQQIKNDTFQLNCDIGLLSVKKGQ